jgi:hypothetical protein
VTQPFSSRRLISSVIVGQLCQLGDPPRTAAEDVEHGGFGAGDLAGPDLLDEQLDEQRRAREQMARDEADPVGPLQIVSDVGRAHIAHYIAS